MKHDHTKHDIEQISYDLKELGKIIGTSDDQILEHFKESLPPKTESQLSEIDDTDTALVKSRALVLQCKVEWSQTAIFSLLAPMINMKDAKSESDDTNT